MPDRGVCKREEKLKGSKKAKDRVTVLLTANMTGTDKRELLVIGKSKRPRCFPRDQSRLPVRYADSANAWMTEDIFTKHVSAWNSVLRFEKRKIALILDNCSAHPSDLQLSNIEFFFLPPNTTSTLQPLDMGVIKNLKCHYRSELNKKVVATLDADETRKAQDAVKSVQLIDTIYMLKDAWTKVTRETISHCWNHAGWRAPEEPCAADLPAFPAPDNLTDEEWESFVGLDHDAETVGDLNDDEITEFVKQRRNDPEVADKAEEEDEAPVPKISRLDVHEALEKL